MNIQTKQVEVILSMNSDGSPIKEIFSAEKDHTFNVISNDGSLLIRITEFNKLYISELEWMPVKIYAPGQWMEVEFPQDKYPYNVTYIN